MYTYLNEDLATERKTAGFFAGVTAPLPNGTGARVRNATFVNSKAEVYVPMYRLTSATRRALTHHAQTHQPTLYDMPASLAGDLFANVCTAEMRLQIFTNPRGRIAMSVNGDCLARVYELVHFMAWREDGEAYPFRIFVRSEIGAVVKGRQEENGQSYVEVYDRDMQVRRIVGNSRAMDFLEWWAWTGSDGQPRKTSWPAPFVLDLRFPNADGLQMQRVFSTEEQAIHFLQGLDEGVGYTDYEVLRTEEV